MSSNTSLYRLTKKKVDELSKILKVDSKSLKRANTAIVAKAATRSQSSSSGPDTHVIRNIQNRINNPLFSLTIDDYELMCGNKIITKMMSKVLECEEKQLKKFCKYINVFKKNIDSSPKSIKNKMKPKMTLNKLPYDLKIQIIEQYKTIFKIKYVLKDWVQKKKLDWDSLSSNPNAIELLKENQDKINWKNLSENPNPEAIELLKENLDEIYWGSLSKNPNAIDLLKDNQNRIDWNILSANPNSEAMELLKKRLKYLRKLSDSEYHELSDYEYLDWDKLSSNPNDGAIELLKANPDDINWGRLSKNPNPSAIELLKTKMIEENEMYEDDYDNLDYYEKINWANLSSNANPEAIELLKENPHNISWWYLSDNPNAIELLKERVDYENTLSKKEFGRLVGYNGINWEMLSENPNAIELLKANQRKIDWDYLSTNPNPEAIELLKANPEYINWSWLSKNPNPEAIELLKKNLDKINWYRLSENPNIFDEILV